MELDSIEPTAAVSETIDYILEDRGRSHTMAVTRSVKLMSSLIQNQTTPKKIRGVEIDENQKLKYSNKKDKVLNLEIEIDVPEYASDGQLIVPDQESEELAPHLDGVFMAHLIDEEYLDEQMALQEEEEKALKPALEGEDLKEDIKKHLGHLDLDSYHSSQRSKSDASRKNSLQSLDNLANQLDMADTRE